jgi:ABC-type branched-subunit amino acid transport system ATPase component
MGIINSSAITRTTQNLNVMYKLTVWEVQLCQQHTHKHPSCWEFKWCISKQLSITTYKHEKTSRDNNGHFTKEDQNDSI